MTQFIYSTLLVLVGADLTWALTRRPGRTLPQVLKGLTAFIAFMGCIFILIRAGRPPLFGPFEASVALLLVSSCLALVFSRRLETPRIFFGVSSAFSLIILLIQLPQSLNLNLVLNPNYYMYENIWVILFFSLRLAGIGALIHGAAQYISGIIDKKSRAQLWAGGRNTLLTATCIYLSGEWAGSLWCLNWLGDSWQWSRGFFKASLVFLLVMGACHLPRSAPGKENIVLRGVTGALPGIFGIFMIFFH